jgi:hypothetical protein
MPPLVLLGNHSKQPDEQGSVRTENAETHLGTMNAEGADGSCYSGVHKDGARNHMTE